MQRNVRCWWKQTYTAPETVFASPFGSAPQLGEVIGLHGTPAIRPHKQIICSVRFRDRNGPPRPVSLTPAPVRRLMGLRPAAKHS